MLNLETRPRFHTLLDALTLAEADERDAIIFVATGGEGVRVTRRAFAAAVRAAAAALVGLGIRPHDLIIIAHTQSLESVYLFWGAMAAGAIPSMFPTLTEKLDAAVYRRNMAELVQLSGVRAILTTAEFAPLLCNTVGCPVYTAADLAAQPSHAVDLPAAAAEATAFLQHSSGTTGLQKGVALSHTAVLNQLASYSSALKLSAADVVVSWLPLYHDMGLIAGFLLPLVQGIPLVLMSPFDWVAHPALLFRAIHAFGGTLCWLPNFAYNHCARRVRQRDVAGLSAASMRLFINCSEPVRADSHALFLERFGPLGVTAEKLAVCYAMAENTFAVTQTEAGAAARVDGETGQVSCGRPIAGTELKIIDEAGVTLPERCEGEIAIRSNCLLSGYYKRLDLVALEGGWFRTGDMGFTADGELFVCGRRKDLIINAGKNIYPQDIEAIVYSVGGVHAGRAVAFGVPDAREGTELIAVVAEVDTADPFERQRINQAIRLAVAQQAAVTVTFVQLVESKWLLKTSSGKVARGANREKWLAFFGERAS